MKGTQEYLSFGVDEERTVNEHTIEKMRNGEELLWFNPSLIKAKEALGKLSISMGDIDDAERRLERFKPFIAKCFEETRAMGGLIESSLDEIPNLQSALGQKHGRLYIKRDDSLPIAGSVKARGGIYEVLKHTEELAARNGLLDGIADYGRLAGEEMRRFFGSYTIQVGSTGNLGLSIGMISAKIGYRVIVHMSSDAKQWKKDMLRANGVEVMEYATDYSEAVKQGRALSAADEKSHFVDDENSLDLFMGYAVAAKRLRSQLEDKGIAVDSKHPLYVYIPCGVGGAPGGIAFGLKHMFGDNVHIYFVEPVQAPCMLAALASGRGSAVSVKDFGLSGITCADGLAVGRASQLVYECMKELLDGEMTVSDGKLFDCLHILMESENIFIEPSACASIAAYRMLMDSAEKKICAALDDNATHIVWATGGRLVPESVRAEYLSL